MAEETDYEMIKSINKYVISMDQNKSTRTIYYTDILATTEKNYAIVKKTIDDYKKDWINREDNR